MCKYLLGKKKTVHKRNPILYAKEKTALVTLCDAYTQFSEKENKNERMIIAGTALILAVQIVTLVMRDGSDWSDENWSQ